MIDQLKSMAIFASVVEEQSFRGAAKQLALSPSVVSHHISQLEKQIGVALLYRSTRALSLTREGEQFYEKAKSMIRAASSGLNMFSDTANTRLTSLRVTIPAVLSSHPIFERFSSFTKNHTGIRLTLTSSDTMHNLFNDSYDVAIRMGRQADSDLKGKRIGEDQLMMVAAPSYLAKKEAPTTPEDLKNWDCISFSSVPDEINLRRDDKKPRPVWGKTAIVVDSVESMRRLAIDGIGIAGLPHCTIKSDLHENRLKEVLPGWSDRMLGIYLVWPKNSDLNSATREFINWMSKS